MSTTDNLYILDTENEPHSIKVLEYFLENILNINKICKRYIRVFQLTPAMLDTREIQDALSQRNVSKLPSLVIFKPRSEVMIGVDEIILFYQTLLANMHQIQQLNYQKRLKAAQESKVQDDYGNEPALLDDTQSLMNNFYGNEIMSGDQEQSVSNDIGNKMSERYRQQLTQRGDSPGRPKSDSLGDDDPLDFNKSLQARRRGNSSTQPVPEEEGDGKGKQRDEAKDDAMDSVRKVTKDNGMDGELEYQFFQNLLEDSSKI